MADVAVTNTLVTGNTITAAEHNTNYGDLVNYINARNNGTAQWDAVESTSSTNVTLICNNSTGTQNIANFQDNGSTIFSIADSSVFTFGGAQALTDVRIDNTAADGDPILAFQLSGTSNFTMGVDDGDSDVFKIGTTAIGTSTALRIAGQTGIVFGDASAAGDGTVHIHTATAGSVTADTNADDLVVENSATGGITILTPNTGIGGLFFGDGDDNNIGQVVYDHNSDFLKFVTNNSGQMQINSDGSVGIGISVADGTLHVHAATAGSVAASVDGDELTLENSGNCGLSILCPNTGIGSIFFGDPEDNDVGSLRYNHSTNAMVLVTSAVVAMTIDSTQQVGIGIASPDGTLHVHTATAGSVTADTNADDLVVENSATGGITILTPNTGVGGLFFGDVDDNNIGQVIYDHNSDFLKFVVNNSARMTIDTSGNVGIATASFGASAAGVLAILNGTQGAAAANMVQITSEDLSAGNTQLSLRTEGGGAVGSGTPSQDRTLAIMVDGTQFHILMSTAAA